MATLEAVGGSFDFGRVVGRTFRVIGDNLGPFAIAALVLVALPVFVTTIVALVSGSALAYSLTSIAGGLIAAIGGMILQGVVVHGAITKLNGRSIATGEIVNVGVRFALPLLGLAIISTFGMMLGFLLLFVPGLILCVMWCVAAPSLVMEKRGVFDSLQRSRDLNPGHRDETNQSGSNESLPGHIDPVIAGRASRLCWASNPDEAKLSDIFR